jgi:SAM-dependent methyltransferase
MKTICPQCRSVNKESTARCECGFQLVVEREELPGWFERVRSILESAYLSARTPWQQSGLSGTIEKWTRLRSPVAECIDAPGKFLDIGCANGFLLECLLEWTSQKGIKIEPYGLDYSERLVALARKRLPDWAGNIFVGNAWDWEPPLRFDYIRTEVCYVPPNFCREYVSGLLNRFLAPGGRLLVAHYRSRREDLSIDWVDDHLRELGFTVTVGSSGYSEDGLELTRVVVIRN